MKIIFTGYRNPRFETVTEYSERAIVKLGHDLVFLDDRNFLFPGRVRDRIKVLHQVDLSLLNFRILSIVKKQRPDVVIASGGHRMLPGTIRAIRKMNIRTALWTIDPPADFAPVIKASAEYDRIFCGGTEAVEILRKTNPHNVHWLPFACETESHHPVQLTPEERARWGSDIVFVGSWYENRAALFLQLAGMNFKIWGPSWRKCLPPDHPLLLHIGGDQTKPEEWIKILCASKIVLIAHYQDGRTPCYQASPKVYETLACKAFALVDNQPDVFSLFDDGKHLAKFTNASNLKERIAYYLEHPDKREAIAECGYEEVVAKHTYVHRMEELLKIMVQEDAK